MVAQTHTTTALARVERGEVELTQSLQALTAQLLDLAEHCNVLSPSSTASAIKPLHAVSLRVVRISPDPADGEVYFNKRFCEVDRRTGKPLDVALTKVGITKLLQAGAVHTEESTRVDDRTDPYFRAYRVGLWMEDYDGKIRRGSATKELDLRDGSPETMKANGQPMEPSGINDARRNIGSLAESKATLRAARALFSLKQKYRVEELARPWVVPVLVVQPDPNNPQDRQWLLESSQRAASALYSRSLPPPVPEMGPSIRDITEEVSPPVRKPREESPEEPAKQTAPAEDEIPEDVDLDFSEDEDAPPLVCGCPCGCQHEISEAVHAAGVEKIGTPRCKDCYPGPAFKFSALHPPSLDLKVPKHPGMTVEKLSTALERAAQKGGGR